MSYCRWSECDVYAYDSCEGGVRFWVAGDDSFNRLCGTYNEAYQYAKELRDKHGFDVPSHAIDALREDAIEEAKQHLGPDSAVADMLADIAKLREDLEFERSENGWAREFLNRMGQKCGTKDCPSLVAYVTKLESENAKLRELCWRMRTYMAGVVEHNGYHIMTTGYTTLGRRIKECDEAMQALGIEEDA